METMHVKLVYVIPLLCALSHVYCNWVIKVDAVRSEDVEFEIMGHLLASAPQTDKEKYSTQREEEEEVCVK